MKNLENPENHIALFKGNTIRRAIYQKEWWFSVIDVIEVLTNTERPRKYWSDLKKKLIKEGYFEVSEKIGQLKMVAPDGKMRETDSATTETMLRIIQSIPSPNAEPFKRWLAKVGFGRIQEIEDPELATRRTKMLYKLKGYSEDWIEKRMRGIAIREELTDEWKKREIKEQREFEILTAEISKATFGMTPIKYKEHKGLKRENLRDHMNDLELIFSMLGEVSTTKITRDRNAKGFIENKIAAQKGGQIAGDARRKLELESGGKVITKENYLTKPQSRKKIKNSPK
ncbi:Bro-N domain-containing protein [Patescibacteria group bacterium]|nr:Bro-N domain-containing protein [Patescibacteria group bacterium]MBU1663467.1 Bro-N domain-containing protein [Patescibacteria group bacterium]MBU1934100.1 Bro-N domain-containing protein [Patescibacteria group bacterium]MBU2007745.1 Bro-N domain-containing protein [Patescibacteria group bacterium]MBU2233870.1 Bro-N domain-containing protein [Patescibacteria group bacterium]